MDTAEIGRTGLRVTRLGLGGAFFGHVAQQASVGSIERALELGTRYFDTAPVYGFGAHGFGKSEEFYSMALAGVPRDDYALSTKVGHILNPRSSEPEEVFDFSRDGVLRSFEESLQRLNIDRIDMLSIHDPDDYHEQAVREAFPALAELRSQGVIKAIGAGMINWEPLAQFAREADFDYFLLAGRYTLLDHSGLKQLLPLCREKQISIILGGPYNSGILASDLKPGTAAYYFYEEAPPEVLEQARKIKAVCDTYNVPLKAAALQFGLAHPAVAATIPGASAAEEVEENLRMVQVSIPDDLWAELKHEGLIPEEAPTP